MILEQGNFCERFPQLSQKPFTDVNGQDKKNYGDGIANPEIPF